MEEGNAPELWARRPEVQQLLGSILAEPLGDHSTAVAQASAGVLLDAHVAGIVRELDGGGLRSNSSFGQSFTTDGGVALHTVLYHLLWESLLPEISAARP
eukprot:6302878-Prymnesium_polylepis.1